MADDPYITTRKPENIMAIITRTHAQRLIREGKADILGAVLDNNTCTVPTYVIVKRYDMQRIDHYVYTDADAKLIETCAA